MATDHTGIKFHKMTLEQRRNALAAIDGMQLQDVLELSGQPGLSFEQAERMVENCIGTYALPLGIARGFLINGREIQVPMVIEEPSVVAAASFMAKLARSAGGFVASADPSVMIGQIQVLDVAVPKAARNRLLAEKELLLKMATDCHPQLARLGGGARSMDVRILQHPLTGRFLVVHVYIDVLDAMGANAVNTSMELLAPEVERITGGRVLLRILSNLADRRLARAKVSIPVAALGFNTFTGEQVRDNILQAWAFAAADSYRAATNNKGIMNGVDAVLLATGNDWRAVEAGAHAYAARKGRYTSLSTWEKGPDGSLVGRLEMPLAVGIVGGATHVHPGARTALKLMGIKTARELAEIIVSVGLAQNLAALRALATEGIQRGHMGLHARQVAIAAGAAPEQAGEIASRMVSEKNIRLERAIDLLSELQESKEEF